MNWMKLSISGLIVFIAAAIGNLATAASIESWYVDLNKPVITPPNWLFGPAWSVLYVLVAISLYLVWMSNTNKSKQAAYRVFAIQLALNTAWSIVFFGLQLPWAAVGVIVVLLASILANIAFFYPQSKLAAALLIPYALWVTYAMALNIGVAALN